MLIRIGLTFLKVKNKIKKINILFLFNLKENRQETMFYSGSRDGLVKVWAIQDNKFRCLGDLNSHSVIIFFYNFWKTLKQ